MSVLTRYACRSVAACLLLFCCAAGASPHGSHASPVSGYLYARAERVVDGDTLVARTEQHRVIRVRLAEIDAPERGEPWSGRARAALERLVAGQPLAIRLFDVDDYGRIVGRVFVADTDVNAELVRLGLAAVYRRYAEDPSLLEIEQAARAARRGFWQGSFVPRGAREPATQEEPPAGGTTGCGARRHCRQMRSCAEATWYLENCGLRGLDGDADGVPCEASLCGATGRRQAN